MPPMTLITYNKFLRLPPALTRPLHPALSPPTSHLPPPLFFRISTPCSPPHSKAPVFEATFFAMPKIEPIETRHSIFEEPSSGSKYTMYFPCCSVSTSMTVSFSSDTNKHVWNDDLSMFINSSFAITSNFCCVSPWTFVKPEIPYLN